MTLPELKQDADRETLSNFIMLSVSDKNRDMIFAERMTDVEREVICTPFKDIDKLSSKNTLFWMSYNHDRLRYRYVADRLISAGVRLPELKLECLTATLTGESYEGTQTDKN